MMDYSKSKTYSKIMWIVYIIVCICAITYISQQEAILKTPIMENVGQDNSVTDISKTDDDNAEDLIEIYLPTDELETNISN